jgi:O-antigen/teichoic acid export membrane protein
VAYLHGPELKWLIISGLIAQGSSVIPMFIASSRELPVTGAGGPTRAWVKSLFSYGGWVTINNILFPLFASLDRFLIGAGIDAAAVAVYSVPYNLVHRFQILPSALARTLFPRLSGSVEHEARYLANRCITTLATITLPVMVAATILIHPFLSLWINGQFASRASGAGEVLIIGTWMSSLAFVPYALLQGQGQPRTVALIHLLEVPFFAPAIWLGVRFGGVIGAAWVMSLRDVIDALIFMVCGKVLAGVAARLSVATAWLIAALVVIRVGNPSSVVTLAISGILVIGSTVWAFRVEPLLSDIVLRVRTRVLRTAEG